MKVPLLDLQAQLEYLEDEILAAVTKVVKSTRYIQGPEVEGLAWKPTDQLGRPIDSAGGIVATCRWCKSAPATPSLVSAACTGCKDLTPTC